MQEGVQRDPSGKSRVCILTHKQVDTWSGDRSRQHLAFMWRSSVHKLAQKHLWLTFNEMSANMSFILFGDCHAYLCVFVCVCVCVCEREREREREREGERELYSCRPPRNQTSWKVTTINHTQPTNISTKAQMDYGAHSQGTLTSENYSSD